MKHWTIKCGFDRMCWDWKRHQFLLLPTIGFIDRRHYYGYTCITFNISWLVWGAWIGIKKNVIWSGDF